MGDAGHAYVYKPRGETLYYYDVNSATRPYVMKEIPMPIGPARWNVNLINQ